MSIPSILTDLATAMVVVVLIGQIILLIIAQIGAISVAWQRLGIGPALSRALDDHPSDALFPSPSPDGLSSSALSHASARYARYAPGSAHPDAPATARTAPVAAALDIPAVPGVSSGRR